MNSTYPFIVFQVIGYKNSGKTTLVEKLVRELTKEDLKVGTLKHHGHGGKPTLPAGTDSSRHRHAGAIISGVEGDGLFQLDMTGSWTLDQLLSFYEGMQIVIVEGFKEADFPKAVIYRNKEDESLLGSCTSVICRIHHEERNDFYLLTKDKEYISMIKKWIVRRIQ
ncbi:molybdopterin-guanine dinucleotide biosynthesis protein B [Bacillaceae bacterium S4-13-58]